MFGICVRLFVFGYSLDTLNMTDIEVQSNQASLFNAILPCNDANMLHEILRSQLMETTQYLYCSHFFTCGNLKCTTDPIQCPFFHFAIARGVGVEVVKGIFNIGSRDRRHVAATNVDSGGNLALHVAAMRSNADVVQVLLEAYPESVRIVNASGWLPLHFAVYNQFVEVVKTILEAWPKAVCSRAANGHLPLHHALYQHAPLSVVELLVIADPTTLQMPTMRGHLPLHIAVRVDSCAVWLNIVPRRCNTEITLDTCHCILLHSARVPA